MIPVDTPSAKDIMAVAVHPQAIVSEGATLEDGVSIGPYAVVGEHVKIRRDTVIDSFAQVLRFTTVGARCHIFPYAVVGNIPQDLKYRGERSYLEIGDNNLIREFVTINPGTQKDSKTTIGNNNLIMAYSHIAHDCIIGDNNILANGATLAGYVEIEDKVVVGGLVAVHQFCRIGSYAIIGGCSKVVQDVPPYSMCDGHPAKIHGLNIVGLRKGGFSREAIACLKKAFKILFFQNHTFDRACKIVKREFPRSPEVNRLIAFISSSKRGICR